MRVQGFDWDDGNWPKCAKHGVTKNEIESLFDDRPNLYSDAKHSQDETRQLAYRANSNGSLVAGRIYLATAKAQTADSTD